MDEIRREQQEMITEQDQGLENLSKALRRQAEMGLAMQGEITEHNGESFFSLDPSPLFSLPCGLESRLAFLTLYTYICTVGLREPYMYLLSRIQWSRA